MEQEKEPFSDSDRAALEALLEDRKRRQWLVDLLKRWATWITAVLLATGAVWDLLIKVAKALGSDKS